MRLLAIAIILFSAAGCGQKEVDIHRTVTRGGLRYEVNSETPFTGRAFSCWPNGQKGSETEYRDGKEHGLTVFRYENGEKKSEGEWREGKLISKKCWDENGKPKPCP